MVVSYNEMKNNKTLNQFVEEPREEKEKKK